MKDFNLLKSGQEEKRRFPRFPVRYFVVSDTDSHPLYSSAIDISKGGLGIISSKEFNCTQGFDVHIRFNVDNSGRFDLQLKARVVWRKGIILDNLYRTGLEIIEVPDAFCRDFQDCLESLSCNPS
ncbi:MAG: PilZ domain-containing protein [Candidatus Aureabacteria bacterium]|nr:PilZ domain-containing protein [Candidatus Auribacterota bacterium]